MKLLCLLLIEIVSVNAWNSMYGSSPKLELEQIDTSTGKPINVGTPLPHEAQAQGLCSVGDGSYFLVGTNLTTQRIAVVEVDLSNGKVKNEVVLPFKTTPLVGVGQYIEYNVNTKEVLCVGQPGGVGPHVLATANLQSGVVTVVAELHDLHSLDVLGGSSAYDPVNDVFWLQLAINQTGAIKMKLYGIDATSGALVYILNPEDGLSTMAFDHQTGLVTGIGFRQNKDSKGPAYFRTVVTLDSKTGDFEEKGVIDGYFGMMAGITTIDWAGRRLFFFGNKTPPSQHPALEVVTRPQALPSMNLVAVDLDKVAVLTEPLACAQFPSCPWSMAWAN